MFEGIKVIKEVPHQEFRTDDYITYLIGEGWQLLSIEPFIFRGKNSFMYILGAATDIKSKSYMDWLPF